jgi:hypothetical protein
MEHQCPQCASVHLTLIRETIYAAEWRCSRCESVFTGPLLSVVLVDRNDARRNSLAAALGDDGIPLFAATRLADLVAWPVGKVLVIDAGSLPGFETGAEQVVILADSDDERRDANALADGRATIIAGTPHALRTTLRAIAAANAAMLLGGGHARPADRRTGAADRRRFTRRDRRS